MQKNNLSNSPRLVELRRKRRKTFKRKVIIFLIFFLILTIGLVFISRIDKININKIEISGNDIVESKTIEEIIKKNLTGNYFWLFPKSNFLIYPKQKIKNDLAANLKRLKSITFNIKDLQTLTITVTEYDGKYLWCGEIIPVFRSSSGDDRCYFLDSNGYIFDEAPYFSGDVYFRFYGWSPDNVLENPVGNYFFPKYFKGLISLKESIAKMNLNPTTFYFDQDGHFSLASEPGLGPDLIFKIDTDYEKIAENLQAAITTEPLQSDLKNKFNSLLYLDLRYGNKVYYKFK